MKLRIPFHWNEKCHDLQKRNESNEKVIQELNVANLRVKCEAEASIYAMQKRMNELENQLGNLCCKCANDKKSERGSIKYVMSAKKDKQEDKPLRKPVKDTPIKKDKKPADKIDMIRGIRKYLKDR